MVRCFTKGGHFREMKDFVPSLSVANVQKCFVIMFPHSAALSFEIRLSFFVKLIVLRC